jgi:hypothetical protein
MVLDASLITGIDPPADIESALAAINTAHNEVSAHVSLALAKNVDPRGSLRANASNATVRCLSNLPLHDMLESRHSMSRVVRGEVSPKAEEWGFQLGSVYIRKVHFRDDLMIRQIEQKVVNRLRLRRFLPPVPGESLWSATARLARSESEDNGQTMVAILFSDLSLQIAAVALRQELR